MAEARSPSKRIEAFLCMQLRTLIAAFILMFAPTSHGATAPKLPTLASQPFLETLPITIENNKIYLNAAVNGKTFRFIFDSGSPTVLTKAVADQLGLDSFGSNTGSDANGQRVTMEQVQINTLALGRVEFKDFTALVFDPTGLDVASCMLEGGVIGSDLFPLAVWQLNAENKTLSLASSTDDLKHIKPAKRVPLLQFGYPYAPIFDYEVGKKYRDKLMLDTGAPVEFTLAEPVFEALLRESQADGSVVGTGYDGESAASVTEPREMARFHVESIKMGELRLKDVEGPVRSKAPTLMGARILESHVVTLDYINNSAYFLPIKARKPTKEASVQFRMVAGRVQVSYLADDSRSKQKGVELGHTVLAINGVDVSNIDDSTRCEKVRWLLALKATPRIEYTLLVDGQLETIIES